MITVYVFPIHLLNLHFKFFNKSTIDAQISFSGTPFIINIARWVGPLIEKIYNNNTQIIFQCLSNGQN